MRTSDFPMHCRTVVSCAYRAIGSDRRRCTVILFALIAGAICADGSVYGDLCDDSLLSASVGVVLGWAVCGGMDWAICRA